MGDFSLLKNVKDQDKMYFILAVTNIYASFFFTKERTETEYRLTVPKNIDHIKLNAMVKKDLVNKKMKYTCVSMEVVDIGQTSSIRGDVMRVLILTPINPVIAGDAYIKISNHFNKKTRQGS